MTESMAQICLSIHQNPSTDNPLPAAIYWKYRLSLIWCLSIQSTCAFPVIVYTIFTISLFYSNTIMAVSYSTQIELSQLLFIPFGENLLAVNRNIYNFLLFYCRVGQTLISQFSVLPKQSCHYWTVECNHEIKRIKFKRVANLIGMT